MALTKEQARQIIDVVAADKTSVHRIDSVFKVIPGGLGWAGTVRNVGPWLSDLKSSVFNEIPESASEYDCNAIAEATTNAISTKGALSSSFPAQTAISISRDTSFGNDYDHQGTKVVMRDGTNYVFDWHANLDVWNPFIYASVVDFHIGKRGVPFNKFNGFK